MLTKQVLFVASVLFILLSLRFWAYYKDLPEYKNGQQVELITTLTTEPQVDVGWQRFTVTDKKGREISILTSSALLYHYGDSVFIDGFFTVRNKRYFIYYPKIQIQNSEHNYLSALNLSIKTSAKSLFDTSLSLTSSELLLGIVFGGRQGLPYVFLEKLRVVGVLHVIAASGMNVTFVASALVGLFGKILKRQLVMILSILGVIFYAFLAGFEPSIVRATIMAIMALTASLLGRQYFGLFALFLTAYGMLFYLPANLFDVGFQLSFLSTLGIIWLKPLFPGQNNFLGADIGTTMAAQITTLPVLFATFGQVGLLSILVNALVLWTIPILMIFGALGVVGGMIFFPLGRIFVWLSLPFLLYFEKAVTFFADKSWVLQVGEFSWPFVIGYYLILASVVIFVKRRAKNLSSL